MKTVLLDPEDEHLRPDLFKANSRYVGINKAAVKYFGEFARLNDV